MGRTEFDCMLCGKHSVKPTCSYPVHLAMESAMFTLLAIIRNRYQDKNKVFVQTGTIELDKEMVLADGTKVEIDLCPSCLNTMAKAYGQFVVDCNKYVLEAGDAVRG